MKLLARISWKLIFKKLTINTNYQYIVYSIWWKERGTWRRYEGTLKNGRKVNDWMKIKCWKRLVFDKENRLCLWANVGWLQQPRAVQAIIGTGKLRFFIQDNLAFSKKKKIYFTHNNSFEVSSLIGFTFNLTLKIWKPSSAASNFTKESVAIRTFRKCGDCNFMIKVKII